MRIGGIDQWITIRGDDRANPVLLIVHGGPGDPQSSLPSLYKVYEHDFTIVQWDQPAPARPMARTRRWHRSRRANDMLAEDLPATAPRLAVPFIAIQGADDIITPTSVARKYFDIVQAPIKKWIEIPAAGHFAIVTHAAQFRDALVQQVRPLAL